MRFFARRGNTLPIGVKFGIKEVHFPMPNFNPIGAKIRVYDPQTEIFTDILSKFGI